VLAKLPRSGPDGAVLDLEDAVPDDAKAEARAVTAAAAAELRDGHPELALFVRVNAVASEWFAADLAEAVVAGIAGVVVPKLESPVQVAVVAEALDARGLTELPIVAGVETAAGVARAEAVLDDARVSVAYFGAEDFVADVGGIRTETGTEVLYARSQVALAARLTGTVAIDQVVTALRDEERFRADAAIGRSLGYRGKLCIHPDQVGWAHAAFSPSAEEVDRARRLLAAYDDAVAAGEAAIAFEGQMVDEPLARQARAVLDAAG
jgi:citrate lyase subunit beta/citryl-CoA lyase